MKKQIIYITGLLCAFFYTVDIQAQNATTNVVAQKIDFDTLRTQKITKVTTKTDTTKGGPLVARAIIGPPPITGITPDRVVYWVHGLGGTQVSLENAAIATENFPVTPIPGFVPRKIKSIIPIGSTNIATGTKNTSYTDASMNNAAITLTQNMGSSRINDVPLSARNPVNDFIISHSQGGIVSRTYDYRKNNNLDAIARQISGIVTFGTPHKGAKILNNTPLILSFASNGAQKLIAGSKAEFDESLAGRLLDLFWAGGTDKIDTVIKKVTDGVANKVLPLLFKDNTAPISQDYKDGAPFLNTLKTNDLASTTHKAAFYGQETEPIIWRTFYNFINKKPEEFATFSADFDQELVDNMNQNAAEYFNRWNFSKAAADMHLANYHDLNWWNFMTSYCSNNCGDLVLCGNAAYCSYQKFKRVADAYNQGVQWFANANDEWKLIIGALEVGPVQDGCVASSDYTVWECDPNAPQNCAWVTYTSISLQGSGIINCAQFNTPTEIYLPNTSIVKTYKDSDGTVTVESASAYPGLQWPALDMQGSNHLQMRNDDNTRKRLNNLFDGAKNASGQWIIDPWFKTVAR
jgi:hypothetical protein